MVRSDAQCISYGLQFIVLFDAGQLLHIQYATCMCVHQYPIVFLAIPCSHTPVGSWECTLAQRSHYWDGFRSCFWCACITGDNQGQDTFRCTIVLSTFLSSQGFSSYNAHE